MEMEEENTEIILQLPQDIHKLCRICLCVSNGELSHEIIIFDEMNNLTEIAEMIQFSTTIKINPTEGLPMSICVECLGKLHICYDFINQSKNSDVTLKKILNLPTNEDTKTTTNLKSEQNLFFHEVNPPQSNSDYDQIDLSQFFEQRHSLVEKYIKNDSQVRQAENDDKDDILTLINNRKEFKSETCEIFIKLEGEASLSEPGDNDSNFECENTFESEENVTEHQTECISEDLKKNVQKKSVKKKKNVTFGCDLCNKCFSTAPKLALHFYNHAKQFQQEKQSNLVKNHDLSVPFETERIHDVKNVSYVCDICSKEFLGEPDLVNHLKKHNISIPFCTICSKRFDSIASLKGHKKMHATEKLKSVFRCPICEEEFGSADSLQEHSLKHLNESYKCDKCVRSFNNIVSYNHHLKLHFEPKHLCSVCGKAYFSRVTLQCHLRSHTNEKPFSCSFCNKSFSSRSTLSVHRRIHSEFKPYVCSYCGYSCRQSGDLSMHIRTHTGDKPYVCTFPNCGRKFTTSSQRREHYRRHTNERNHKCKDCGKAFLESKTLKVHMLIHTGDKPYNCNSCGKKFRRIHHLNNHMKSHATSNEKTLMSNVTKNKKLMKCSKAFEPLILDWSTNDKLTTPSPESTVIEHII